MGFSELLIKEYAKKIYDFAFSKTNDYHNARNLSQNILIKFRFYPPCAFPWLLMKKGFISEPKDDEKKRMCTIIWGNQ